MALRSVRWITTALPFALLFNVNVLAQQGDYRGKPLGKLSQLHHGVSGEVFAVDARTLHIRNFNYDGEGPAAYFYVGTSKTPGNAGFRIRDERGTTNVLPRYRNQDITVTLPEGKTLQNIRWFSVWCDEFAVNFGDVKIPKGFDFPRPFKLGTLGGIHGVSSDPVVIVDAQTLLIPNFSYDGEAPDAKFWVGQGAKPSPQGIKIPDENGKIDPLRRYDRKTIVLTLPNDMTVFDIGHFGVWCEAFAVDFGHVQLPQGLNVPPSLKMLGVSPQKKSRSLELANFVQNLYQAQQPQQDTSLARPLFYSDIRKDPLELQDIKPTTYRPAFRRQDLISRRQGGQEPNFEIQQSLQHSEYVIHDDTGDFVKPLDIQFSRKQEVRYEPTPAERILQHNPPEPPEYIDQQQLQGRSPYNQYQQAHIQPNNYIQQNQQQFQPQGNFLPQNAFYQQQQAPVQQNLPIQHALQPQPVQQQYQQYKQQQYAPEPATYQLPPPVTTSHFGKVFPQMNIEHNVNHNPHSGSYSRFVINRSTDTGYFHRF